MEISQELARLTLRRINGLSEQKGFDPPLYETYYWGSSPEYFSPRMTRGSQPGDVQESGVELEQMLENLKVDTRETVTAPPDFRVPESQAAVVECAQMIVRDGGIAFTALLRHTDIYLTTAEIPKEIIDSVMTPATA
ncbi:MAG: hypothetical protein ACYDDI_04700 [Candidatus Acidiferrales bacterium]